MTSPAAGTLLESDPFARVAALPAVGDAVIAARVAVDALLRHRVLRRRSAEITAEVTLRAARASAALDGHEIPLETLRAHLLRASADAGDGGAALEDAQAVEDGNGGASGDDGEVRPASRENRSPADSAAPVPLAALRLYAELGSLAPAWERAPRQALARMHVLAARGIVADSDLGRPRSAEDADRNAHLGLGPAPTRTESAARLDGLMSLLVQPTSAPATVVAAIVHGELVALRPFGSLDGIVARAAARLVHLSRGLDPKALTATDVGHLADEVSYAEAARGYVDGGPDGVQRWVVHCCRAVELGARESLAICEALLRAS